MYNRAVDTASVESIYTHLNNCKHLFVPSLETTVDIKEYAAKIRNHGKTFEIWHKEHLIALVAVYLNDFQIKRGFVTNVSTELAYNGMGFATELLTCCIEHAMQNGFETLDLQVHENNLAAKALYLKLNFQERANDKHLLTMSLNLKNYNI